MTQSPPSLLERAGNTYVQAIVRYFTRPEDPTELQVRKGLLSGSVALVLPATLIWGAAYLYYGESLAALITYGYMLLSITALIHLRRTGRIEPLATIQILCTLLIPFILTLVLGGIVSSSAIILAAIMSPLGILMHSPSRQARRWFAAFIALFILAAAA